MSSASPEIVEPSHAEIVAAFVGIDPDDVEVVKMQGAEFTLGVVDVDRWETARSKLDAARVRATAAAITAITDAGGDPAALPTPGVNLTAAQLTAIADPEFRKVSRDVTLELLSWSLKEVKGFVNRHGQPFPFIRKANGQLDEATMRVYARNPDIYNILYIRMMKMNDLGLIEKKSSGQ